MASCNDETPVPQHGTEEVVLHIGIANPMTTKAPANDGNYLEGEDLISNLTVLLFEPAPSGKFVDGKTVESKEKGVSVDSIGGVIVYADSYDIVLVANAKTDILEKAKAGGISSLNSNGELLVYQEQDSLLMVSEVFRNIELKSHDTKPRLSYNYLLADKNVAVQTFPGYNYTEAQKVVMTRQTARIQLESIAVDFVDQFAGASFRLDSVFVVNLRAGTKLTDDSNNYESTSADFNRGGPQNFDPEMTYIVSANTTLNNDLFLKNYENIVLIDGDDARKSKSFIDAIGKPTLGESFSCYAFENHTKYGVGDPGVGDTRMIIAGEIILANGTKLGQTYYQIPIVGENGETVNRNYVYKVNVTIKGLGSDGPDKRDHYVAFQPKITVEKWKIIKQVETDDDFK